MTEESQLVSKVEVNQEGSCFHHAVSPGTWFSRFMDIAPGGKNSPKYCLVGVSLAPGFDIKDLVSKKYIDIMQPEV